MLVNWAKNTKDEKKITQWWFTFNYRNGHKEINAKNFLKLNYTYISYRVEKRYYEGYFTTFEADSIFKLLDYKKGIIRSLAG